MVNWQERIVIEPDILAGKPVIRGTQLSVEFTIDLTAQGWLETQILRNYPGPRKEDIRACLANAGSILHAGKVYPMVSVQQMRILTDENFRLTLWML